MSYEFRWRETLAEVWRNAPRSRLLPEVTSSAGLFTGSSVISVTGRRLCSHCPARCINHVDLEVSNAFFSWLLLFFAWKRYSLNPKSMSDYSLFGQSSLCMCLCSYVTESSELWSCVHSLTALLFDMISELNLQFMNCIVLRNWTSDMTLFIT